MSYIINLFGTGIRYWNCEGAQKVFDDMNRIDIKKGKSLVLIAGAWGSIMR
jgi:hypothetical protein